MGHEPREDHQDGRGSKEVVKERSSGDQESHGLPRYVNNIYEFGMVLKYFFL